MPACGRRGFAPTALGWNYVGRLRHRALVQLHAGMPWIANRALHGQARSQPQRFRDAHIVRNAPWQCDRVLVRKRHQGRQRFTVRGRRARSRKSLKAECAGREPWLLASSLRDLNSQQIVALYAKRMQIEESFRDLKCDRFGCAFCYSLTRTAPQACQPAAGARPRHLRRVARRLGRRYLGQGPLRRYPHCPSAAPLFAPAPRLGSLAATHHAALAVVLVASLPASATLGVTCTGNSGMICGETQGRYPLLSFFGRPGGRHCNTHPAGFSGC